MKSNANGPVKSGNTQGQDNNESTVSLPVGCDQDFVYYED